MTNPKLHLPSHFTQWSYPVTDNKWAYLGYSANAPWLFCFDSKQSQTTLHTGTHTDVNTHPCTCPGYGLKWVMNVVSKRQGKVLHLLSAATTSHSHPTYRPRDSHSIHAHFFSLLRFSHSAQQRFLASTSHTFTLFSSWPTPWQHVIELRWGRWRWSGQFSAFPTRISIATLYCLHCLPQ